jgi:hypothetical protein
MGAQVARKMGVQGLLSGMDSIGSGTGVPRRALSPTPTPATILVVDDRETNVRRLARLLICERRARPQVRPIVRHYHERLDGRGDPDGRRRGDMLRPEPCTDHLSQLG